jgi:aldehyde:ferredoxin oxidoreductase
VYGGYVKKILFINLSTGELQIEEPEEEFYRDFLGGYGIGARVIYSHQKPRVVPLSVDNILGFATGPLTGTPSLIASRYTVMGKSPLTGTWGDANSGGFFGPILKFAGYDGLFFTGVSEEPVYLFINNGIAELQDAGEIWGTDTRQTQEFLKARHGRNISIACIGPAGEKRSLISCIMNDSGRAAGRSGLGALMGSKKLKAIAVKGNTRVLLADKEETLRLRKKYLGELSGLVVDVFRDYGSSGLVQDYIADGEAPIKNWRGEGLKDFPNAAAISDESVIRYQIRATGCYGCPLKCGGQVKVEDGPYKSESRKPEFQTIGAFGPLCLNDNIESIIKANEICDRYGIDTVSTGSTIAFALECYENNIITKEDTDGLELTWGNHEAIIKLTEKIAKREGFGDVLADGVKKAAERLGKGAEAFAMHVQGQEIPMHSPRRSSGYATTYKIDATPARHTQGGTAYESSIRLEDNLQLKSANRGEVHKRMNNFIHVINCVGWCLFGIMCIDARAVTEFIKAVVGWEYTMDELLKTGERIANIRHAFNLREGLNPLDFKIPKRVLKKQETFADIVGGEIDVDTQVHEYLMAMDWDLQTTYPIRKKLVELGLDDVACDLWDGV